MTTHVTATFVGGLLRSDQSLPLADHTRVHLTIEPIGEKREAAVAWAALKARLRQRPVHGLGKRYTRDELHERR
jgi:hypothetical protein